MSSNRKIALKCRPGQLSDGKWAVFKDKRTYYTDSVCDTEVEAKVKALEYSARYYQMHLDRCRDAWEQLTENPDGGARLYTEASVFHDLLC